jgi:hypothetical protein
MPSKKKKASRAAQLQPQAVHSDYDTDTAAITDAAPAMAPPPARTNTELNMLVLRRYVPETERIISIAPFAVVYIFSPETQQWEKSGVEGTLFVCQLSGSPHPRYNVVILNRKSLDNFVTELVSEDDIEITEQYVILQVLGENEVPIIYGLWIFSEEGQGVHSTREIVATAIQECAMRAAHANFSKNGVDEDAFEQVEEYNLDGSADTEPQDLYQPTHSQPSGQQIDLLSLFNKSSEPVMAQQHMNGRNPGAQEMMDHFFAQPTQFIQTADTDFFRSSNSPAAGTQARAQPPAQQNHLLNLFKSANG